MKILAPLRESFTIMNGLITSIPWLNWFDLVSNVGTEYYVTQHTRNMALAAATITITGAPFKPSACVFFCAVDGGANAAVSFGFETGGNSYCVYNLHNVAANTWGSNGYIGSILTAAAQGVFLHTAAYQNGGMTFTLDKWGVPGGTVVINILLLK